MSVQESIDPSLMDVKPEVGQVYKISGRDDVYQILYIDEYIVLLRCDTSTRGESNSHRIERRIQFDKQIESGWFNYQPNTDLDMLAAEDQEWSEVDNIGRVTEENLHNAGYKNALDIQQAGDDELLAVDGLGNAGLRNLKEFAR